MTTRRRLLLLLPLILLAGCHSSEGPSGPDPAPIQVRLDEYPSWGAADSVLAFHRALASSLGPPGLYVSRSGGPPRFVADGDFLWPMDIAVSPDGRQAAAVWDGQLYLVDLESETRRLLVATSNGAFRPSWSPDSRSLVYARAFLPHGQPPDSAGIHVVEIATGQDRAIISPSGEGFAGDFPRWSPDGEWIVVSDGTRIDVVRPDGTASRTVVAARPGYVHDYGRWLSSSREILFESRNNTGRGLVRVDLEGPFRFPWSPYLAPQSVLSQDGRRAVEPRGVLVNGQLYSFLVTIRLPDGAPIDTLADEFPPVPMP